MGWNIFKRPPKETKCPYCELDWEYMEKFKILKGKCVFRIHDVLMPRRIDRVEAYEFLSENGFKVISSTMEYGHFVVKIGGGYTNYG